MEGTMEIHEKPIKSLLLQGIKENSGTTMFIGVILLITGALAIAAPLMAAISITLMIGALMIVSGFAECILAFKAGAFGRGILVFLMGALMVVVGIFLMTQPLASVMSMTLFLAAYFVVSGFLELFAAFSIRPAEGWGWILLNAVVTILLGFMIFEEFPVSGIWAIGILFGIKLLFSGAMLLGLGMSVRRGVRTIESN